LKPLNFHNPDARPEDVDMQLGVSNKFKDPDLKAQVEEMIQNAVPSSHSNEDTIDITSTLENIAGKSGAYARIPRSQLEGTPIEWNQFTPISTDKKVLMAESIYCNGLLQPIVVRAINESNDHFQILAGNTRNELFGTLYDITRDEKYLAIDAKVYWYGELTDEQAREIVTDTNYVQRANLTAKDRVFCIHNKVEMLKKRGESDIMAKVAEQMEIKKSTAFYWNKLANLISGFFEMFQSDKLSLLAASRLASFPQPVQYELYEMKDLLTNEVIMKVPAKAKEDRVVDLFRSILDSTTAPKPSYSIDASWTEEDGKFAIRAKTPPPEGSQPLLVYIPKKKLKAFLKTYEDFVVKEQ
jgi:ParB family chromosome partitioning protein